MACHRRVYACRVSFLNCNQIHPSLPQLLAPASLPRSTAAAAAATTARKDADNEENAELDVLDFWRPLFPAPPQAATQSTRSRADGSNGSDAAMLNVWTCPEIDSRQRRERMRRQKAEQLAERMTALVHASNINKDRQEASAKRDAEHRGVKRKPSDVPAESSGGVESPPPKVVAVPFLPSSPDLAKPQSLLIPSLLPKGMLRTPIDNTAVSASTQAKTIASRPPALDLGLAVPDPSSSLLDDGLSGAMPFSLGLDLGFDIAQNAALRRNPQSGNDLDMSNSIMEIADFLERDIDVFTPMSAAWTPRLTTAPNMPSGFPSSSGGMNPKSPASKQRELIEDIVKLSV
ncbi:hypothetical protein GGF42_002736 [Coemansia sp. RSA 2424]|nr:hypothetical protein GGF42_002736 [Coemansia sp. RSA 2424]